jgi:hypothetical protein
MAETENVEISWVMQEDEKAKRKEGHEVIGIVYQALGQLGYQIDRIVYRNGHLDIGCYCPMNSNG